MEIRKIYKRCEHKVYQANPEKIYSEKKIYKVYKNSKRYDKKRVN
jgi:hypothetical protein